MSLLRSLGLVFTLATNITLLRSCLYQTAYEHYARTIFYYLRLTVQTVAIPFRSSERALDCRDG